MSYVFRLHSTGNIQLKNWESSSLIRETDVATIVDTLQQSNDAKLGSSIPSPLARMYLFETAFKIVGEGQLADNSVYHQLVSDCLDLYQLLYLYSQTEEITFQKWDKRERLTALSNSVLKEHKQLAKALEIFFNSRGFRDINDIYLIYYNNRLVGGTSPLTGLYVSPNWKRLCQEHGWSFTTQIGDNLFDNIPFALHERDEDFKVYMHRFISAYKDSIVQVSPAFYNYFFRSGRHSEDLLLRFNIDGYTERQLYEDYGSISIGDDSNHELRAGRWSIMRPKEDDNKVVDLISSKSDFLMEPTVDYYNTRIVDGREIPIHTPLVLAEGNHNLNYIESRWRANQTVDDIPFIPLEDRKLPGNNIKYPYVTTGDFLEGELVRLPFNIDNDHFFTGYDGHFPFLLPIKKTYFNFFTLEDLKRQLKIEKDNRKQQLHVSLDIPTRHGRSIQLRKTYDIAPDSDQVQALVGNLGLNLGIFPFLRVNGEEGINTYMVMLATNLPKVNLHFYRFDEICRQKEVGATKVQRSEVLNDDLNTFYYSINNRTFDCMELAIGEEISAQGLIIPAFKEIRADRLLKDFFFAIDFGTTNTHVAYVDGLAIQRKEKSPVVSFDIMESDRQMVLLSEIVHSSDNMPWDKRIATGAKIFGWTTTFFDREFFLSFIGEAMPFEFPIRTTVCESFLTNGYEENPLFSRSNIGFFFEKDSNLNSNIYHSNIKWAVERGQTGKPKQRVEVFIHELLWSIKNKLLLNHGSLSPTIIWMVPLSMSKRLIALYEKMWEEQATKVFGPDHSVELVMKYESIVPFYALKGIRRNTDVLNIDIGGGTTDVLFFYRSQNRYFSTSFKFAGNDIWGEGLEEAGSQDENGFLAMMNRCIEKEEHLIGNKDNHTLSVYKKQKESLGSADLCSLLFKYDDLFRFSEKIRRHQPLQTILVIHLAAIIFHLSQIIKDKEVDIPQYISFSGRGSKYIFLITESKRFIQDLVLDLFEAFSEKPISSQGRVSLNSNPKVITAEGALLQEQFNEQEKIDRKVESIVHLGVDDTPFRPDFTVGQIDLIKDDSSFHFQDFLDALQEPKVQKIFKELEISFRFGSLDVVERLKDLAPRSYREMVQRLEETHDEDLDAFLEETPFFWYLKDSLYHLSKELEKKLNIRCGEDE